MAISATVGNAVADGSLASLRLGIVVPGVIGNATAAGRTASITSGATPTMTFYLNILNGKLMLLKSLN